MFDDGGGGFDGFNAGGGGGAYAGGGAATGGDTGYGGYTAGGGGGGGAYGGGGGAYGGGGGGDYAFGGGGGGPSSSQNKNFGTPSSAKKDYDEPSISPLTVRQLLNAESEAADSHHMVDGKTLHKVKVVGCILSIQDASAFTAVQLDDSTGVILVKDWERDHLRTASLREGMYVRVIGTFQAPKGKPSLIASNMSAITDMDEITAHYLDAIYTHLYRTTSPDKHPAAQAAAAAGSGFAATSAYGAPAGGMGGGMGGATFGAASSAGFAATSAGFNMGGDVDTSALPPLHKKVLDTIGANKNGDRGTSIDEVVAQVGAPPAQVRKAVDNLAQEGHLYSTVDENHWQVTCAT